MNYTPEYVTEVIRKKVYEAGNAKKLSEQIGLDISRISRWKNGKSLPQPETFFKYFPIEEELRQTEPKKASKPKQIPVETLFVADHRQEMMDALCNTIREKLRQHYKRCFIRVGTMDYHNVLVITLTHQVGRDRSNTMLFRQIYPDPVDHSYLDPDWATVVMKSFIKKADAWILKQFKG